jgi:hypothetical protein
MPPTAGRLAREAHGSAATFDSYARPTSPPLANITKGVAEAMPAG